MATGQITPPPGFELEDPHAGITPPPGFELEKNEAQTAKPESAASRFGSSFASGAGVVSPEQGKNFFRHPLDTAKSMINAQGELGERAGREFKAGDYKGAVAHGAEFLLPGIGPTLAHSGDQLESGDVAGGIGTMAGAGATMVAGTPEGRAIPGKVATSGVEAAAKIGEKARNVTPKQAAQTIGGVGGGVVGHGPVGSPAGVFYGAKGGGNLAESILGKDRANAPIFKKSAPPAASIDEPGPIGAEANKEPEAAATIKPTVTKIADQVQDGLGGKKLVPNLPLRMQAGGPGARPAPAAASIEPEHMGQFARANGLDLHQAIPESVEGDVLRAKIHGMTNVQVRQLAINAGEDMGQKAVTNAKNSGGITRQDVLKRVMAKHSPQEIGTMIDQGKHLQ